MTHKKSRLFCVVKFRVFETTRRKENPSRIEKWNPGKKGIKISISSWIFLTTRGAGIHKEIRRMIFQNPRFQKPNKTLENGCKSNVNLIAKPISTPEWKKITEITLFSRRIKHLRIMGSYPQPIFTMEVFFLKMAFFGFFFGKIITLAMTNSSSSGTII